MPNLALILRTHPGQAQSHTFCNRQKLSPFTRSLVIVGVLMLATTAQAADVQSPQTRYQADRAACLKGDAHQDREACLNEAGAALQESKKNGSVKSSSPNSAQDIAKNRSLRCEALPLPDQEDCVRRMQGEGEVEGSVKAGGVLRTLERPIAPKPAQ